MTATPRRLPWRPSLAVVGAIVVAASLALTATPRQDRPATQGFSFRTSVALTSVTATVTDASGRFVPNLRKDDFEVYEDGKLQTLSQFDAERVPVSLGIALDTSGSMLGEKIDAAEAALNRFLYKLLGPDDEIFLYRFDARPELLQGWTTDRQALSRALGSVRPNGGTAIYDAVAEAIPLAQRGTRKKKALVILSDGNDTSSRTRLVDLHQIIRESEVLVYAIGIDASGKESNAPAAGAQQGSSTRPTPMPFPGKRPPAPASSSSTAPTGPSGPIRGSGSNDRVNGTLLRSITDESGGRTEIVVSNRDLDPATAGIAAELSQQYFLGYASSVPKDGQWHTIEVRVKHGNYTIRSRKGFIAN